MASSSGCTPTLSSAGACRRSGKILPASDRRAQAGDQLLLRQRARLEERLHQLVVGLGHHLDERLARAASAASAIVGRHRRPR